MSTSGRLSRAMPGRQKTGLPAYVRLMYRSKTYSAARRYASSALGCKSAIKMGRGTLLAAPAAAGLLVGMKTEQSVRMRMLFDQGHEPKARQHGSPEPCCAHNMGRCTAELAAAPGGIPAAIMRRHRHTHVCGIAIVARCCAQPCGCGKSAARLLFNRPRSLTPAAVARRASGPQQPQCCSL